MDQLDSTSTPLQAAPDDVAAIKRTKREAMLAAQRAETKRRHDANREARVCINEGKGIRAVPHGQLAPKLDSKGNVIGHYIRCTACVAVHQKSAGTSAERATRRKS